MNFATLLDVLDFRRRHNGAQVAFTFQDRPTTFGELWEGIEYFAAALIDRGLPPRAPVITLFPNGPEFFTAFYGVQRAGGIAVPLFPASSSARVESIARQCEATWVVLPQAEKERLAKDNAASGLHWISLPEARRLSHRTAAFPAVQSDDIAFLQYTSGSTGEPKGVMLSHANLLTNLQQMIAGMQITAQEIFVSWLPIYHDMGLILKTMVPFYLAAPVHLLPTDLRAAHTWLAAIQRYRATFTAAPDFAYRLAVRSVEHTHGYDLSSLRVALDAAEPVRAQTIADFEQLFGLKQVMVAGYGLAEATVGVSMMTPGCPPRLDAHGLVSVGRPFPQVELKIVQGDVDLPAGAVGEIAIRSAANSRGYFNDPVGTAALIWRDGFLLSGDLGYLDAEGYLTIVGRKKNTIKHAGETIAPQEIEELVDAIPDVRYTAALGIDRGRLEGEQVYIFAELRGLSSAEAGEAIVLRIVNDFHARLGFRPARVYLVKPHTIPRTYNGKIQHAELKSAYLQGRLRAEGSILYPDY